MENQPKSINTILYYDENPVIPLRKFIFLFDGNYYPDYEIIIGNSVSYFIRIDYEMYEKLSNESLNDTDRYKRLNSYEEYRRSSFSDDEVLYSIIEYK